MPRGHVARLLQRARNAGGIWCASAAWSSPWTDGEAHEGTLGVGCSEAVDRRTIYDLASLTKVLAVTPLAILTVREKRLRWDTSVAEVFPETYGNHPLARVTIESLLRHETPLPAWYPLYAVSGAEPRAAENVISELPLEPLGSASHRYSCPGFILLGAILEQVWRSSLRELFRTRVSGPLGLSGEIGFWSAEVCSRGRVCSAARSPGAESVLCENLGIAAPWLRSAGGEVCRPDDGNARWLGGAAGNAGLFGTAASVAGIAREFLCGGGELITAAEADNVATSSGSAGAGAGSRGRGWSRSDLPGSSAGPRMSPGSIGHTGFTGTSVWIDRRRSAVLVLLANRVHPGHRNADLQPLRRAFHRLVLTS